MNIRAYRLSRITAIALAVITVGLGLNYHKDIIQFFNVKKLISEGLDGRLVPHRINHTDKLQAVLDNGIQSFEVDLMFYEENGHAFFEVGHGINELSGLKFDQYLSKIKACDVRKMWLDIKNIREQDIDVVIAELERLDFVHAIKRRAIIESSITTTGFRRISRRGFHTSYYLPTNRIAGLLSKNDKDLLRAEANRLNEQIRGQEVEAVSFDLLLYPFVKNYLEPMIPDSIVYHTWDSVRLWQFHAIDRLKRSDYFKDRRVKTILYKYWGSGVF
jgi:hypothetical protein